MEATVAQKLDFLLQLQAIDSQLDEIKRSAGICPEEVRDLEDDIVGFETRVKRHRDTIDTWILKSTGIARPSVMLKN